ncbi:hypothetical protein KFE25_008833 [Diacronema lutheri]|uniref:Uncharacterized protein n=1 Tax=Diacronema lutheri TaxID=2081491 RepID=A0A8J5XX97_DIALT|nr:hypothetical protein KFE25_008833 [Diacronema lutheri]
MALLSAGSVRGTMTCLSARHWALSPAVGLALAQDAGLWANLRAASEDRTDGLSRLLRALYWAPCAEAPIRRTRNESLPAAHLTPELLGHVAGLGMLTRASDDAIHTRLRELGVSQLARSTGVSIARFVRLSLEFRAAAAPGGHAAELAQHIVHPAYALASTFAWELCSDREQLLRYLLALREYAPDLLADDRLSGCAVRRAEWLQSELSASELVAVEPLGDAARTLLASPDWESLPPAELHRAADAFELLAAASCSTGDAVGPPAVQQARYGFRGQPARADCVEVVLRQLLDWLLWCPTRGGFDLRRLPPNALPQVRAFWEAQAQGGSGSAAEREAALGQRWFDVCARLRPCAFLAGSAERGGAYELAPTLANLTAALSALLGVRLGSVRDLEALPRLVSAPMAPISVHVDRTWADREGFTLRLAERQLSVVLKEISNHAFVTHAKSKRAHLARAALLVGASWRDGGLRAGPLWCVASRLVPPDVLLHASGDRAGEPATTNAPRTRGSRAATHMAVLSCRLTDGDIIASALARECEHVERSHAHRDEQQPCSSWGGSAGLVPMLAVGACRHASLSAPHAQATMRSASWLARAVRALPEADAAALVRHVAAAPPLAALVAIHSGDSTLLASACRSLSTADVARLLWPAMMVRRRRDGSNGAMELHAQAASSRWVLAAVVLAAAGTRVLRAAHSCVAPFGANKARDDRPSRAEAER